MHTFLCFTPYCFQKFCEVQRKGLSLVFGIVARVLVAGIKLQCVIRNVLLSFVLVYCCGRCISLSGFDHCILAFGFVKLLKFLLCCAFKEFEDSPFTDSKPLKRASINRQLCKVAEILAVLCTFKELFG